MSLDDLLKSARAAVRHEHPAAAIKDLEDALLLLRKDAALDIREAVPVNHDHTGIGLYTPAENGVVDGRRVRLYVEVANFTLAAVGPAVGHAQLDVTGDFSFEDPALPKDDKGGPGLKPLQKGVSLGTQAFDTRTPLGVTSFGVEIGLGDKSPAGGYRVLVRVRDAIGNKTATREARFVLR